MFISVIFGDLKPVITIFNDRKKYKKNDGNRRGCDFGEMTGIIGKMTGKSTWKVSGMESFYYYLLVNTKNYYELLVTTSNY